MNVEIEEITQDVYEVTLSQYDPDLLALAVRAEDAADSAEQSANDAAQSALDAQDAISQIGGFYNLEDAPGYDAGSPGQSITNVGGVLIWQSL